MVELFWLLLPVAACSGWLAATKQNTTKITKVNHNSFKFNQKYIKGLNLILDDETDKAVDVFLDLFSVDNDTVETHMALGSLFRRRGEVERALRIHQNIIARPNLCPEQRLNGMLELGHDYLCAGVLDRAENIFRDIIKQYQNNQQALKYLLDIYQQQCDWPSAIDIALLLQKHTNNKYAKNIAHYYCELAEKKINAHDYNDSFALNKQALRYQSDNVRANLILAGIYIKSEQVKKGLKIYFELADNSKKYLDVILPLLITSYCDFYGNKTQNLIAFIEDLIETHPHILTISEVRAFLVEVQGHNRLGILISKASEKTAKLSFIYGLLEWIGKDGFTKPENYYIFNTYIQKALSNLKKYNCVHCGFSYRQLLWLCPSCKSWDTIHHIDFYE